MSLLRVWFVVWVALFGFVGCSTFGTQGSLDSESGVGAEEGSTTATGDDESDPDAEPAEETPGDLGEAVVSEEPDPEERQADALAKTTFPLVYNDYVEQWLRYFTGRRGQSTFERWLSRSTRYIPLMKQILKEEGVPEDLIYLAMIESGFNTKALSRAKAMGPWQFMKGTGTRYGLEVSYWVDERRDFIKSTHAAARYLKELHTIFGSWYLAAASYNAGEGRTLSAVREHKTRNFWQLIRNKKAFRAETRNYVPKMMAAAILSKNPEKYGFTNVDYQNPWAWEEQEVAGGVDLKDVARLTGADYETLRLLNPELTRGITPPKVSSYRIRVTPEAHPILVSKMSELKGKKLSDMSLHRVRPGETLGAIARRYGTSVYAIMEFNNIRDARSVRAGREIEIPIDDEGPRTKRRRKR